MLKEMAVPLIAGTVITALLFLGNELIAVFQKLNLNNVPPAAIAKYILYLLPTYLYFTIPIGVAMGVSLAISRITRDGELTAMRAAGIPIRRVFFMVAVVGVLYGAASFYNNDVLIPIAEKEKVKLANELLLVAIMPKFEQNKAIELPPYVASFGNVQEQGDQLLLQDILLIDRQQPQELLIYIAPRGRYSHGVWTIEQPRLRMFKDDAFVDIYDVDRIVINQRIDIRDFMAGAKAETASSAELMERIKVARETKSPTVHLELPLHERRSIAASCVVFALMAGVLGVRFSRGSAFQGLLMSLVSLWMFLNFHIVMVSVVGKNGWLPPAVAAWTPFTIFALGTIYGMWRQE